MKTTAGLGSKQVVGAWVMVLFALVTSVTWLAAPRAAVSAASLGGASSHLDLNGRHMPVRVQTAAAMATASVTITQAITLVVATHPATLAVPAALTATLLVTAAPAISLTPMVASNAGTATLPVSSTPVVTTTFSSKSTVATPAVACTQGSPFSFWKDRALRPVLGCPTNAPHIEVSVEETFQRGFMLWRADVGRIYAVYDNGTWTEFPRGPEDVYDEGWDKEFSCESPSSPPSPRRGFSKVWCAHYEVHMGLGNATEYEQGFCMDGGNACEIFQDFANGFMYRSNRFETLFVFLPDGTWRKE